MEDGSLEVLCGSQDAHTKRDYAINYFNSLTQEQVVEKYGDDPEFYWRYEYPQITRDHTYFYNNWDYFAIDWRDYQWFGLIAGVRGNQVSALTTPRGIPQDTHPYILSFINPYHDLHSHSWATIAELKEYVQPLYNSHHFEWFDEVIPDQHNVRMVYAFDN